MSPRAVQFGIVGAGRIAHNAFAPALRSTEHAELAAAASRDARRAESLKPKRAYTRYQSLLEDSDVDAVYIATHNGLHHPLTLQALACGKHVLCEKPLARTAAECREMIDAARHHALTLVEGFMYRYHPQVAEAQRLLPEIGELRTIEASFSYRLDREDDVRWNRDWGGGSLYDVGCYCVNICRMLFEATPRTVSAQATFHPIHQVDVALHDVLDFGEGRYGIVSCGFDAGLRRRVLMCGTGGTISLPFAFFRRPDPVPLILNECLNPRTLTIPAADVFKLQIEDFARAVRGLSTPLLEAEDGYRNASVIDALLQSARRGGAPQPVQA